MACVQPAASAAPATPSSVTSGLAIVTPAGAVHVMVLPPPAVPGTGLANSYRPPLQLPYNVLASAASIATSAPSHPPGWYHVRFPNDRTVPLSCVPPAMMLAEACCDVAR